MNNKRKPDGTDAQDYSIYAETPDAWRIEGKASGYVFNIRFPSQGAAEQWAAERAQVQQDKANGKPVMMAGSTHHFGRP